MTANLNGFVYEFLDEAAGFCTGCKNGAVPYAPLEIVPPVPALADRLKSGIDIMSMAPVIMVVSAENFAAGVTRRVRALAIQFMLNGAEAWWRREAGRGVSVP